MTAWALGSPCFDFSFDTLWFKCPKGKKSRRGHGTCATPSRVVDTQEAEDKGRGSRLVCATCGHPIARESHRMEMSGSHTHGFTNPHGLYFEIGCFSQAPGCRFDAHASDEFTWFPGYSWRIAVCGGCTTHMGWRFESRAHGFVGLLLAAITIEKDS